MYKFVGTHLPKMIQESYKEVFEYSSLYMNFEKFLGFLFVFGLLFSIAITLLVHIVIVLSSVIFALAFVSIYGVFIFSVYMLLWFSAEAKGNFVNSILPDVLNIMSVNLRSGLTLDRAFILTARPEFGPLEDEIKNAGKKILSGRNLAEALLGMTKGIKSELFEKTMNLIVEGISAGGELAKLLEATAQDIERTKQIESEVNASILMYVIFIFFAAAIGVPVIYGISTNVVDVMIHQSSQLDISALSGLETSGGIKGINVGGFTSFNISSGFLVFFAVTAMIITSIFAGLIIGLIRNGKEKAGVKLIPLIMIISLGLFFVTRSVLTTLIPI